MILKTEDLRDSIAPDATLVHFVSGTLLTTTVSPTQRATWRVVEVVALLDRGVQSGPDHQPLPLHLD